MTETRYMCRACSKRFRKLVYCMTPTCKRCTSVCATEIKDEETGNMSFSVPHTAPILAKARSLQAQRRLR